MPGLDLITNLLSGGVADLFKTVMDEIKLSPEQRAAAEQSLLTHQERMQELANQLLVAQTEINKQEAASPNWFVAGWRPACGWVCSLGLGVQFLINPLATWIAALAGHSIQFPSLDMGTLITLLIGLLGLGGYRTYEKTQGVQNNH